MEVSIDTSAHGTVELRDADDFTSFKVVVRGEGDLERALGENGRPAGRDVLISIDAVRRLAGSRGDDPAWQEGLSGMVRYAQSHGWVDESGRSIRGHVERIG